MEKPKILSLNEKIGFGKYVGCTVSEVAKRDPKYLKWLETNTNWELSKETKTLLRKKVKLDNPIRAFDKDTPIEPGMQIGFGKYKGETIDSLIYSAPGYVKWLYESAGYTFSVTLKRVLIRENII